MTFNENAMLSSVKDTVISSIDIGDQEDAREKVEFEIKTPAHEEDVPNSSSTQDGQVHMSNVHLNDEDYHSRGLWLKNFHNRDQENRLKD